MNSQLYIPEKLKIGFQKRNDTYNGKLGYVIYYDQVGILRKEAGWNGWRDKTIEPQEFDNVPTEGFVLNKDVGGVRHSWSWNGRMEKVRVYDPRGFEFEISIPNLLFILTECNAIKGKGLEGEFVYAWAGKELVLCPIVSQEYKSSKKFTKLQAQKILSKDLILGASYLTKQEDTLIYLGRFMWYEKASWKSKAKAEKRYVFVKDGVGDNIKLFIDFKDISKLSAVISDVSVDNYAELMDQFGKSKYASKPVKLTSKPLEEIEINSEIYNNKSHHYYGYSCIKQEIGKLDLYGVYTDYRVEPYAEFDSKNPSSDSVLKGFKIRPYYNHWLDNNLNLTDEHIQSKGLSHYNRINNLSYENEFIMTEEQLRSESWQKCFVLLESGAEIELKKY